MCHLIPDRSPAPGKFPQMIVPLNLLPFARLPPPSHHTFHPTSICLSPSFRLGTEISPLETEAAREHHSASLRLAQAGKIGCPWEATVHAIMVGASGVRLIEPRSRCCRRLDRFSLGCRDHRCHNQHKRVSGFSLLRSEIGETSSAVVIFLSMIFSFSAAIAVSPESAFSLTRFSVSARPVSTTRVSW